MIKPCSPGWIAEASAQIETPHSPEYQSKKWKTFSLNLPKWCFQGNPFQDKDYWHRAREILPSITYLDDRDVDYKEETDDFENLLGILPKLGF